MADIKQSNFKEKLLSNKVIRRDYSKINFEFEGPNLLEIQKKSFQQFLDVELDKIVRSIFPIVSPQGKYTIDVNGWTLADPIIDPKKAQDESKTYESSLYVDLSLINNETGEIKKVKKSKNSKYPGIFFGNIPLMIDKGTFIVNGIEKFVIAQIIRSPGAYILNKSQIKLNNSRKRVLEGNICEILPYKGTLMLLNVPEGKKYVQLMARDSSGASAPVFMITTILKALGLRENTILDIFDHDIHIVETLANDPYKVSIFESSDAFKNYLKTLYNDYLENNMDAELITSKGGPLEYKLRKYSLEYEILNRKIIDLKEIDESKNAKEIAKLITEQKELIELIINESSAKYIVDSLNLSIKSLDITKTNTEIDVDRQTYQGLIILHLFNSRYYFLSNAGRYKINRKLRLTERLYQQTIADDIYDVNGNLVIPKNTLISKKELDIIKNKVKDGTINLTKQAHVDNIVIFDKKDVFLEYEKINVYPNNDITLPKTPILGIGSGCESLTLTLSDLISSISYAFNLDDNIGNFDDIDHLGNKRLKLISELLSTRLNLAMIRIEKFIREKLAIADGANAADNKLDDEQEEQLEKDTSITIKSVINTKQFQIQLKDFFNSYQLIQFIDQQNPLSELTNKRRISAMGPGGISREDPNLDIRDVHYSHYGRICPIETPEGANVGLILSLASFSKVNENGFIETPYRKVINGVVTDEIVWLTPLQDDEYIIAESGAKLNDKNEILDQFVVARYRGSSDLFDPKLVDFMDVLPKQVVSVATSAIPFLENDDANRALMGANMQRQAAPLIKPYAPIVGTGSEIKIAHDSGMAINAIKDGVVKAVDGNCIIVESDDDIQTYDLVKYKKSNQDTCINQTPIVDVGQAVKANETIANGPAMQNGELALGRNVLVGFSTWNGYNFEDAIVISERLVNDDVFTSIHIDEHTLTCVSTKNGDEEITREIPNVPDSAKRFLDDDGLVLVGSEVKEGDILVGKITPRGQVNLSSEEKLLQAIFGEKTKQVKESSLKVPNGGAGIVAAVKRFKNIDSNSNVNDDVIEIIKVYIVQKRKIQVGDKMSGRHGNKGIVSNVVPVADMPFLEDGTPLDILLNPLGVPSRMNIGQILEIHLGMSSRELGKKFLIERTFNNISPKELSNLFGFREIISEKLIDKLQKLFNKYNIKSSDEALKVVTNNDIIIALKEVGLCIDDLTYKIKTPVFEGVSNDDLMNIMVEAGLKPYETLGKMKLRDGMTGQYFDGSISVGVMYMLKLDHMVDDKIHARSVGSYSKITQQPLGGKSQNGGQRFGEMEVWALEAYGAAHNLREILTIKSDDVRGRNQTYNAIIKGHDIPIGGMPESFKLLTKKLQGLGMYLDIIDQNNNHIDVNNYIGHEYDFIEDQEPKFIRRDDEIEDDDSYASIIKQDEYFDNDINE